MTPPLSDRQLYFLCFGVAFGLSALLTPIMRWIAVHFGVLDRPITEVKTHRHPVPYLGGVAVAGALALTLIASRLLTQFPTGTLHSLRGIFLGGLIIVLLGLFDDVMPKGIGYRFKFVVQFVAAISLIAFDMKIKFIQPSWLGNFLTVVWVVGIINAVNIVDIMDGLASGVGVIAALGFLFISLPSEEIYVNFTAAALAGSLLAFMPYNFSRRMKIFLGDTGSLLIGFILAALSLGTSYSKVNNLGVFAPLLILGLPIYDTLLVTYFRLMRGMSPFLGSRDHFALRLEKYGFFREEILVISFSAGLLLSFAAYEITIVSNPYAILIYCVIGVSAFAVSAWLSRIRIS